MNGQVISDDQQQFVRDVLARQRPDLQERSAPERVGEPSEYIFRTCKKSTSEFVSAPPTLRRRRRSKLLKTSSSGRVRVYQQYAGRTPYGWRGAALNRRRTARFSMKSCSSSSRLRRCKLIRCARRIALTNPLEPGADRQASRVGSDKYAIGRVLECQHEDHGRPNP